MARQSAFKKGGSGGFLNNVDGRITGYEFLPHWPGQAPKAGQEPARSAKGFLSLYTVLSVRVDGAEADVQTTLFSGDADQFEISDDGQTVTPVVDGFQLGGGTALSKFIGSWEEHAEGKSAGASSDDDTVVNFAPIVGSRVRFVQEPLSEKELAALKKKGRATEREYTAPDGTKKKAPLTELVVAAVYEVAAVKATKGGTKKAAKGVDMTDVADESLIGILAANGNSITKAKVSVKALMLKIDADQKSAVRKLYQDDAYLGRENGWTYNKATGAIELEA